MNTQNAETPKAPVNHNLDAPYFNPTTESKITLAKVNTWTTEDGGGLQCEVHFEGRKVGVVTDHGMGGPEDWGITDRKAYEEAEAYAASFRSQEFYGFLMKPSLYTAVNDLVNYRELKKKFTAGLKRKAKNAVCFRLPNMAPTEYRYIACGAHPGSVDKVKAHIAQKYPEATIIATPVDGVLATADEVPLWDPEKS